MNKLTLLLFILLFGVQTTYSQTDDLGVYCGSVEFLPPSFLNKSFLGGSYTWYIETRTPDLENLDNTNGTWPTKLDAYTTNGSSGVLSADNANFLGKQIRIRVQRGTFYSQWTYFYILPNNDLNNYGSFAANSQTDACKGKYYEFTFNNDAPDKVNLILYGNYYDEATGTNLYYSPPGVNNNLEIELNTIKSLALEINPTESLSVTEQNNRFGTFHIEQDGYKLRVYNKNETAPLDNSIIHFQLFSHNGDINDINKLDQLLSEQLTGENICSVIRNKTLEYTPKSDLELTINGQDINATTTTLSYNATQYYENIVFALNPVGGGYGSESSYTITNVTVNHPNDDNTNTLEFTTTKTQDFTIETDCEDLDKSTLSFSITVNQPSVPTFGDDKVDIDNDNPLGKIILSNIGFPSSIDESKHNISFELYKGGIFVLSKSVTDLTEDIEFDNLFGDYTVKLTVENIDSGGKFFVENKENNLSKVFSFNNSGRSNVYTATLESTIPHLSSGASSDLTYDVPVVVNAHGTVGIETEIEIFDGDESKGKLDINFFDGSGNVVFQDLLVARWDDAEPKNYTIKIIEKYNGEIIYEETNIDALQLQEANPIIISDNGTDPLFTETQYSMGNTPNELAKFSVNIQGDQDLTYYIYKTYQDTDGNNVWDLSYQSVNVGTSGNNVDISSLYPDLEYRVLITDRLYPDNQNKDDIILALDDPANNLYEGQCWVSTSESFSVLESNIDNIVLSSAQLLSDNYQILCKNGNLSISSPLSSSITNYEAPYYYIGTAVPTQLSQFERISTITSPMGFDTNERVNLKNYTEGSYKVYILEKPVYDLHSDNIARGFYEASSFVLNEPEIIDITLSIERNYTGNDGQIFHVSRYNGTDGEVRASVEGGQPPFTLTLENGATSDTYTQNNILDSFLFSDLSAAEFNIISVLDDLGCTTSAVVNPVTLSNPNPLQIDEFESVHNYGNLGYDISEYQGEDGAITIRVSEGIADYTAYLYHREDGQSVYNLVRTSETPFSSTETEEFTDLEKGFYKVIVVDKYFDQNLPDQFTDITAEVEINPTIHGDIAIWENDIELVEPNELVVTIQSLENYQTHPDSTAYHVQCNFGDKAKNGIAYISLSGGIPLTGPEGQFYDIEFNRGGESVSTEVKVTKNADGNWVVNTSIDQLHAGNVFVSIKDSQGTEAENQDILVPPHPIEVVYQRPKAPDCIDSDNGAIRMEIKGGIPIKDNQTYTLTFGNDVRVYEQLENYPEAEGQKIFTLKDAYNCPCEIIDDTQTEFVESFYEVDQLNTLQTYNQGVVDKIKEDPLDRDQWSEPSTFMYYLSDYFPFSVRVQSDSTNCFEGNDGFFTITNFYGGAGENYSLEVRKGNQIVSEKTDIMASDQIIIDNLDAGSYILSLKDNLCNNYRNIDTVFVAKYVGPNGETPSLDQFSFGRADIREPDPLTANITPIQTSCYGTPSGELSMNITGGHLPYTITVYVENTANKGGYDSLVYKETVNDHLVVVDQLFGNKKYRIHISDRMSCEVETRYLNSIEKLDDGSYYYGVYYIDERPSVTLPMTSNIASLEQSCENVSDGSFWFNTLGNPTGTLFRWIDDIGQPTSEISVVTPNLIEKLEWNNLTKGTYTLQFKESLNCDWKTTTRVKKIEVLPNLFLEIDKVLNIGNDNYSVFLNGNTTKGNLRIEKRHTDGTWFELQSIKVNNENIFLENLPEGEYQFTLYYTDIPECTSFIKTLDTKTADIVEFAAIVHTDSPSCGNTPNGKASFELINRIQAEIRTISWKDENEINLGETISIDNLSEGSYVLELVDNNGIKVRTPFTLSSPSELSIVEELTLAPNCTDGLDGQVILQVIGGTTDRYNFNWVDINTLNTVSNDQVLTNVPTGIYDVTISDPNNPTCETSSRVEIPEANALHVDNIIITNPTFNGISNGGIEISIKGGVSPYIVYWKNQKQYGNTLLNLPIGSYPVLITDKNNCQKDTIITIDQEPEPLNVSILSKVDETCYGARNGLVEIEVTGGTAPYFIEWNNNQRGATLSGVSEGRYTAKVTDASGYHSLFDIDIDGNTPMKISLNQIIHPSCVGSNDGVMILEITGGTGDYQFDFGPEIKISKEGDVFTVSGFESGRYDVNITDEKGCAVSLYDNRFLDPEPIVIDNFILTEPLCNGGADGSIEVFVSGGSGNYTYSWEGQTSVNSKLENITAGTYKVIITDSDKGCSIEKSFILSQASQLNARVVKLTNPMCIGAFDGSITVEASGGSAPYSYLWSDGQTTPTAKTLGAGTYSVIITDKNQCSFNIEYTLEEPLPIQINVPNLEKFIEICEGTTFSLNAGDEWSKVEWSSDRGLYSEEQEMLFTTSGNYQLKVTNTSGCQDSVSFEVVTRDDLLNANYVIESSPEHGIDTYHIIDLSWPIPDNIEWSIEPKVTVVDSTDHELEIRFIEKGTHTITLRAMLSGCLAEVQREIEVITNTNGRLVVFDPKSQKESQDKDVVLMDVHPNPSSGKLNINIEFIETMDAVLTLRTLGDNKKIWEENLRNKSNYSLVYTNTKLPTGLYLLQLTTNKTVHVVKVMIMK
ncbi:hypothetical protein MY04_3352 [Flammeovirga sp. MY04]|uniref:SprB repeat-containing protein n=1 Tax=Flammeovirga sp. MY04 TaxID=1191459 RepID=UPI00080631DE|nr:SprB repeat-containing protein [Flammeovirga sp. MY04]ANQ50714.1 hypothetical protein MY04_3352 [Flammeovirga sp. MY04]